MAEVVYDCSSLRLRENRVSMFNNRVTKVNNRRQEKAQILYGKNSKMYHNFILNYLFVSGIIILTF